MYYPAWMPLIVWSCATVAVGCAFLRSRSQDGRLHRRLDLGIFVLLAASLALGGTMGLLFNCRAPRVTVDGVIYDVQATASGKGRSFKIFTRPEIAEPLELSWNDARIQDGQLARVTWQEGSHRLLAVEVLFGPDAGYRLQREDGIAGAVYCLIGGALVLAFGVVRFESTAGLEDPEINHHVVQRYHAIGIDPGPVDDASALHLNARDEGPRLPGVLQGP